MHSQLSFQASGMPIHGPGESMPSDWLVGSKALQVYFRAVYIMLERVVMKICAQNVLSSENRPGRFSSMM